MYLCPAALECFNVVPIINKNTKTSISNGKVKSNFFLVRNKLTIENNRKPATTTICCDAKNDIKFSYIALP